MNTAYRNRKRQTLWASVVLGVVLVATGCGLDMSQMPFVPTPTPTFTPTPSPTPSPTPVPTKAGETAAATPVPTPQVTIPQGFSAVEDDRLAYSFAVPGGWTELDVRSSQFQQMADMLGMGEQLGPLNVFLASPEGEMLGKIYITDLTAAMFGGLPTVLVVSVVDAPGYTPETARKLVEDMIKANAAALGDIKIEQVEATTVNNLPAVRATATANLASVGMNASAFAKVVGLLANDKIYVMALLTQENQRAAKEPVFDQIIGSFRPE